MAAIDRIQVLPNGQLFDNQNGLIVLPTPMHDAGCPARPIDNIRSAMRRPSDGVYFTLTECLRCSAHRVDF